MKKLNLFILFFTIATISIAQSPPDILWTKTISGGGRYNVVGNSVQQTSDGGFIITGTSHSSSSGTYEVWLIKTDGSGETLWRKRFSGGEGKSVQQTSDGGYIITGTSYSSSSGTYDVWLIKTNASGDTLWTKTFGDEYIDAGFSVLQTSDGGYIITGRKGLNSSTLNWSFACLIKTDALGDTLWTKILTNGVGNSVQQTSDGGYIIAGNNTVSGDQYPSRSLFFIKTDASGNILWEQGTSGRANSVQQTSDGGYIITGSFLKDPRGGNWFRLTIKTDASGNIIVTQIDEISGDEIGNSVKQTPDGGYIVVGSPNLYFSKYDPSLNISWTYFHEDSWGTSIQQTSDGGYIVTGGVEGDGDDLLLIRFAADPVGIKDDPSIIPSSFSLSQNYPNPFNPSTTIEYDLPKSSDVRIEVYNIAGQKLQTLLNEKMPAGSNQVEFNAQHLSSGIYYYRIEAGKFQDVKKMILIK